jgi:5-methylcytosine-specific restriction endonuclease McrA
MYCEKCKRTHGNPLKQSDYTDVKLYRTTNASYHRFADAEDLRERNLLYDCINGKTSIRYVEMHGEYEDYLKSEQWKKLRLQILERDSGTCQICGDKAETVHHLTYKHLKNEYLFELVSLCATCHKNEYHQDK